MKYLSQRIQPLIRISRKLRGRRSGQGVKWPEDFQQKAVELMAAGGMSADELAERIGVTPNTLRVWRKAPERKSNNDDFRRLKVVDRPKSIKQTKSPVKMFVTTAQGSEIHGLSPSDIGELVRKGIL